MLLEPIRVFLPCRMGSERVPRKNIRRFGSFSHGLIEIKLKQLLACQEIDEIVLSTNDEEIINYVNRLNESRISVHQRSAHLCSSSTSTDDLIDHVTDIIDSGHILWTHVTSPFVGTSIYSEIIKSYKDALNIGFDSLITTTLLRTFIWDDGGPVNYDRNIEKWPRTQNINPMHEVNSAVFLASIDIYREQNDRIGNNPMLYPLEKFSSIDIDWEEDFILAEQLMLSRLVSVL